MQSLRKIITYSQRRILSIINQKLFTHIVSLRKIGEANLIRFISNSKKSERILIVKIIRKNEFINSTNDLNKIFSKGYKNRERKRVKRFY